MPYDLNVYLSRHDMPAPAEWRTAIIAVGFPVELDTDFNPDTFRGFLPSPVRGEMSGFEYHSRRIGAEEARKLDIEPTYNFEVSFVVGSRPLELMSAVSAASVLASISHGVLVDPQSGEVVTAANAVTWAKAQIAQAGG